MKHICLSVLGHQDVTLDIVLCFLLGFFLMDGGIGMERDLLGCLVEGLFG